MRRDTVTHKRASALSTWQAPLLAAILAADATAPEGFGPRDVRFFFLLFSNWMGDDRLRPGADLDPTQVRRTLSHLSSEKLANAVSGGRAPRWRLTVPGVARLVDELTDPRAVRRFEEVILLANVAAAYAETIVTRVCTGGRAEERRVRSRLNPRAILRAERRRLEDALVDLEARRAAGPEMAAAARAALAAGDDPVRAAARLEASGVRYQLHPMRPLREVLAALPEPLRRYELDRGVEARARWMFGPLCDEVRARIALIASLEVEIGAAEG